MPRSGSIGTLRRIKALSEILRLLTADLGVAWQALSGEHTCVACSNGDAPGIRGLASEAWGLVNEEDLPINQGSIIWERVIGRLGDRWGLHQSLST